MKGPVLGVIPARLGSSRLPRKPLHPLAGRPLIEWVWRRVSSVALFDRVIVATDSVQVLDVVRSFGGIAELTSAAHPSGTDRVAEIVGRPGYARYRSIVNVQGDEPFVDADHIDAALNPVVDGGWDVGTVATPIVDENEWRDPAAVKVVRGDDGGAMLFTRAPVPFVRDGRPGAAEFASGAFLRHIGIYAYARSALERWVALPESPLERLERLEQLRPLAAGIRIAVAVVGPAEPGVDTPEDAARAERRLREQSSNQTA